MPANNSPTPPTGSDTNSPDAHPAFGDATYWTPTGSVEAPKCCGYRVTYDPAVPMGEVRIVNAQGDTVVTLDLIHGGYTMHPPPTRAQAKGDFSKGLLPPTGGPVAWRLRSYIGAGESVSYFTTRDEATAHGRGEYRVDALYASPPVSAPAEQKPRTCASCGQPDVKGTHDINAGCVAKPGSYFIPASADTADTPSAQGE